MNVRNRTTPNTLRPLYPSLWRPHEASARQPLMVVGADDPGELTKAVEHRVELELTHYAGTRARYRVTYLGKTLIKSARDPEFEACRALLAKGITGTLVTYSPGSSVPCMRIDIAKGAQLMTIDNAEDGPRIGRYRPHPKTTEQDDAE
jgi:hypothetical protein